MKKFVRPFDCPCMTAMIKGRKAIVCGGRDYADADMAEYLLTWLAPAAIAHGDARGADRLAHDWAIRHGVVVTRYPADWSLGRKAGPLRNQHMLEDFKPDFVVAFPGGRGTADMVKRAKEARIATYELL
jgi:hypothetical protein